MLLTVAGVGSLVGVGQLTAPSSASPSASSTKDCVAFCRKCDECYVSDAAAKASCRFLMNADQDSCEQSCQKGEIPKAVQRGGFGDNWSTLTCEQLNATL
jgi:hypothetical protein